MQFYFIRHGQSANNLLWSLTGSDDGRSADPELSEFGHRQAQCLAEFLRTSEKDQAGQIRDTQNREGFKLTHLYCSLMLRAVGTADYLSKALNLPLNAWVEWHEEGGIHLYNEETGVSEGHPGSNRAYFETYYPNLGLPEGLGETGWWNRPREEPGEYMPRARRVLAELIRRHGGTDDHVAVVSHGGFYNDFLAALMGLDQLPFTWFTMNNAGITRINFHDGRPNIAYCNRTDFLPDELIT